MKALFLTTILPSKKQIGSEVASQSLIEALRTNDVEVDVIGYVRPEDRNIAAPGEIPVEARYIESRSAKLYPLLWLLLSLVRGIPYSVSKYQSAQYRSIASRLAKNLKYDLLVIDHPQMGWIARSILNRAGSLVFVAHNVEHEMYSQLASTHRRIAMRVLFRRESKLVRRMEYWLASVASEIWTLTAQDAAHFQNAVPGAKVREMPVPASSSARPLTSTVKHIDVALIGSWGWTANREALDWFLEEVCPFIPAELTVQIGGKGGEYASGRYPNVRYVGFVPDAVAFLQSARVIAIPTLSGGGIQIKTLDAIASGSRVVATPCAVRGIADPPDSVAVASDARSFAAQITSAARTQWSEEQCERAVAWSNDRGRKFVLQVQLACQTIALGKVLKRDAEDFGRSHTNINQPG
jgi:hypothetical protein